MVDTLAGLGGSVVVVIIFILAFIVLRSVRIAQEYERAVIFSLGRVTSHPRGPGLFIVWPWERAQKMDIRTVTLAIQPQDCINSDNVTVKIDAVAYFRIGYAALALLNDGDCMLG